MVALRGGRSDFVGDLRQMMPPYMLDGRNTAQMLIANMDYAQVSGCVLTQEYIDGNQDAYLLQCREEYPGAIAAIREAIDICGIEKLMWGSDYPRTMTAITYLMSRDFIEKSSDFTAQEKAAFLGDNAKRFYGFGDLPKPEKIINMVE